jgi:hypothetical protein
MDFYNADSVEGVHDTFHVIVVSENIVPNLEDAYSNDALGWKWTHG